MDKFQGEFSELESLVSELGPEVSGRTIMGRGSFEVKIKPSSTGGQKRAPCRFRGRRPLRLNSKKP